MSLDLYALIKFNLFKYTKYKLDKHLLAGFYPPYKNFAVR